MLQYCESSRRQYIHTVQFVAFFSPICTATEGGTLNPFSHISKLQGFLVSNKDSCTTNSVKSVRFFNSYLPSENWLK